MQSKSKNLYTYIYIDTRAYAFIGFAPTSRASGRNNIPRNMSTRTFLENNVGIRFISNEILRQYYVDRDRRALSGYLDRNTHPSARVRHAYILHVYCDKNRENL